MNNRLLIFAILFLGMLNQGKTQNENDPLESVLFSPELIMMHQKDLMIKPEQKEAIVTKFQETQGKFTSLQWDLQAAMAELSDQVKENSIDEKKALTQLNKVLDLERSIKQLQLSMMIFIKNQLTPQQQELLQKIKAKERLRKENAQYPKGQSHHFKERP